NAGDLAKRGVRLLRRGGVHARADSPLLRGASEGGRLRLGLRGHSALPYELVHRRQRVGLFLSIRFKRTKRPARGFSARAKPAGMVATGIAPCRPPLRPVPRGAERLAQSSAYG